ncbi:DNA mismatch repair endonuclease MutL [Candidatus Babeliales bacterium]|nr:DNA mismatch repair endonuclease MutL [Candidatus Babeliales bacterium]
MQNIIKVLPHHEAIKIAAGEVIERPSHIIKELIENSIDAGATAITIHLSHAGKTMIKITDNGQGMSPDDALLCFAHHATSKIQSVLDLQNITTYGFRGEALSSIAAVSHAELITKTEQEKVATQLNLEFGTLKNQTQTAHQTGTTFTITHLFDNIPARKKFLKSDDVEWNAISTIFQAFCLRFLNVHFRMFHNDYLAYNCPPTDSCIVRCAQIWNNNAHQHLLEIPTTTHKDIIISGIISSPHYYRFNRGHIFTFVNNRWVKNQEIIKGMLQGYQGVLPHQKYPAGCLFISVDPTTIDINIHPKKEEVKFLHPAIIQKLCQTTVQETLSNHVTSKITQPTPTITPPAFTVPANVDIASLQDPFEEHEQSAPSTPKVAAPLFQALHKPTTINHLPATKIEIPSSNQSLLQEPTYSIIGQYHQTYIIMQQQNDLILIDQHAAHERILYQRLLTSTENISVQLMFPHVIKLAANAPQFVHTYQHLLQQHSIFIDIFSDQEIILNATPAGIHATATEEIIRMIHNESITSFENIFEQIHEKIVAAKACKAACKAGDILDMQQMSNLVKELMATPNRFSCPHGRPTMWDLSLKEIEKQFKRDYVGSKKVSMNML